jgi:hypothetical protein
MGSNQIAIRKDTRVLSNKVRAAAEARSFRAPLIVRGISPGRLVTITPSRFGKLDVDPAYQRGETAMVGEIVRVVQAGGQVLDPVTICTRPWSDDPSTLWVVDGHQRVCAFQQLSIPFQAMIHESESLDAEKLFFVSLNTRKAVSADLILKSWTGASGTLIRAANENPDHSLFGRVHMQQGANKSRIGGLVLARTLLAASTGREPNGPASAILARLDNALQDRASRARAEHMMRLLPLIFTNSPPGIIVSIALGHVAYERWTVSIGLPKLSIIEKLRSTKWEDEVPAMTKKFRPVLSEIIKRTWRA